MMPTGAAPTGVSRRGAHHRRLRSTPTLDGPIPLAVAASRRAAAAATVPMQMQMQMHLPSMTMPMTMTMPMPMPAAVSNARMHHRRGLSLDQIRPSVLFDRAAAMSSPVRPPFMVTDPAHHAPMPTLGRPTYGHNRHHSVQTLSAGPDGLLGFASFPVSFVGLDGLGFGSAPLPVVAEQVISESVPEPMPLSLPMSTSMPLSMPPPVTVQESLSLPLSDPSPLSASSSSSSTDTSGLAIAGTVLDASIEQTGVSAEAVQAFIGPQDNSTHKWPCLFPGCGKTFGRRENIRSHVQTHLGDRQFRCNRCGKCFVRMHDLKRHAKIHSGHKPYQCACAQGFARQDALTRHRQRGMCSGAFPNAVRKHARRGRPRKNQAEGSATTAANKMLSSESALGLVEKKPSSSSKKKQDRVVVDAATGLPVLSPATLGSGTSKQYSTPPTSPDTVPSSASFSTTSMKTEPVMDQVGSMETHLPTEPHMSVASLGPLGPIDRHIPTDPLGSMDGHLSTDPLGPVDSHISTDPLGPIDQAVDPTGLAPGAQPDLFLPFFQADQPLPSVHVSGPDLNSSVVTGDEPGEAAAMVRVVSRGLDALHLGSDWPLSEPGPGRESLGPVANSAHYGQTPFDLFGVDWLVPTTEAPM